MKSHELVQNYPVSKVAKNEWSAWAMYTITDRAIPHICDGLKPSQRIVLYSSIQNTAKEYDRVSAVSGVVSKYGYHHGESAAAGALSLMAAPWNNNICLIEGRGDFGTRLVQSIGAPRYVNSRLHANFHKYVKDIDSAPIHPDPEHLAPKHYVPVIPLVLVNGVRGIASAFATNILPHDPLAVANACEEYLKTGTIKERIPLKFPDFKGTISYDAKAGRYSLRGIIERKGKTVVEIHEVPYGYDRETFVTELDKLETEGKIVGYEDHCGKVGFKFIVKMKSGSDKMTDEQILSMFKLVKNMSENLTVIDFDGKPKKYDEARSVVIDFVEWKLNNTLPQRIEKSLHKHVHEYRWCQVREKFVDLLLNDKIEFKGRKKVDVVKDIISVTEGCIKITEDEADRLLRQNLMSFTLELVEELKKEQQQHLKLIEYWKTTTAKNEFLKDLKELAKG